MHIAFAIVTAFVAWQRGYLRDWTKYHHTMLYMFSMGMLYEFLTRDYHLWLFNSDFLLNRPMITILYATITMPLSVLMFLSRCPTEIRKVVIYYCLWIIIYIGGEFILGIFGRISYFHGWNLWWSLLFDCIMFPMLRLHFKHPLAAYMLSIPIIMMYIFVFKVPIHNIHP
jgi:hypothetical protein